MSRVSLPSLYQTHARNVVMSLEGKLKTISSEFKRILEVCLGVGRGCILEARSVRRRLTHGLTHGLTHAHSATLADPHREPQEAARAARAVFGCQLPPIHHQHILYVHIYCHSSFSSLTPPLPPKCPARSWTQMKAKALH